MLSGTSVSAPLLYKISQEFQKPMEYFLTFREEDDTAEWNEPYFAG